jgi:predicted dienelactone hydrolase
VDAYYPAVNPDSEVVRAAPPDASDGPYPVIIGVDNLAMFGPHLASHGFVLLAVKTQAPTEEVDTPLELSSALDALEELSGLPLSGLADTDRTGVMGYSGESLFALMLAGARIDPDHWTATCDSPPESWGDQFKTMVCSESPPIVTERAEAVGIATSEGLWGSLRDGRIRASIAMGPRGFYLTGPKGLATGEAPILMIVGSEDTERAMETAGILEDYPTGLASAITIIGNDHMLVFDSDAFAQLQGFALAFFSQQLKGEEDYAQYLTREFVEEVAPLGESITFDALAWGVPTP